jgi:hypothetical protein
MTNQCRSPKLRVAQPPLFSVECRFNPERIGIIQPSVAPKAFGATLGNRTHFQPVDFQTATKGVAFVFSGR